MTLPTLPSAATHKGRTVYRDGGAMAEPGKIAAYNPVVAAPNHFHALITPNKTPTYDEYVAASLPKNFGAPSDTFTGTFASLAAPDFFIEDYEGKVDISNTFSGSAYRTFGDSFYAYYLNWNDAVTTDTQHANLVLGTSPLFASFTAATDVNTALTTLVDNSAAWAALHGASPIIEYEFLPEIFATGQDFGYLDYNKATGFGDSLSPNGLFVDWSNKRYMSGYLNFTSATPRLTTVVGQVTSSGLAIDGNGFISGGNALLGTIYDSLAIEDGTTVGTQASEIKGFSGTLNAKATDLYSPLSSQRVEGLVLEGAVLNRNADNSNRNIVQPAILSNGGIPIANVNAAADFNDDGETIIHKGFSAGLMTDAGGNVSRIKTVDAADVSINLNRETTVTNSNYIGLSDIKYREVDAVGVFNPTATNATPRTIRFGGDANDGKSAIIERDRYIAQAENTANISGAQLPKGVIASAKAVGAESLVCSSCTFAHWGVWSASVPNTTAANSIQSSIIPYVAGELTNVAPSGNTGPGGIHKYSGDIAANVKSGANLSNQTGSFSAVIDLGNRRLAAYSGTVAGNTFGFNATNDATAGAAGFSALASTFNTGSPPVNAGTTNGGYIIPDGTVGFSAIPVVELSGTPTNITGSLNGALFGPAAEELGGNFNIKNNTTNDLAAGIFLGKR